MNCAAYANLGESVSLTLEQCKHSRSKIHASPGCNVGMVTMSASAGGSSASRCPLAYLHSRQQSVCYTCAQRDTYTQSEAMLVVYTE